MRLQGRSTALHPLRQAHRRSVGLEWRRILPDRETRRVQGLDVPGLLQACLVPHAPDLQSLLRAFKALLHALLVLLITKLQLALLLLLLQLDLGMPVAGSKPI